MHARMGRRSQGNMQPAPAPKGQAAPARPRRSPAWRGTRRQPWSRAAGRPWRARTGAGRRPRPHRRAKPSRTHPTRLYRTVHGAPRVAAYSRGKAGSGTCMRHGEELTHMRTRVCPRAARACARAYCEETCVCCRLDMARAGPGTCANMSSAAPLQRSTQRAARSPSSSSVCAMKSVVAGAPSDESRSTTRPPSRTKPASASMSCTAAGS